LNFEATFSRSFCFVFGRASPMLVAHRTLRHMGTGEQ
jgi:hypothetical protein